MAVVYVGTVETLPAVANADSIVIDRGGQNITSSVDLSAIAGVADLSVGRKFSGNLGSPSSYFKAAITGRALWQGSGNWYYTIDGSGTDACAKLINDGYGSVYVAGAGTLTRCDAMSGSTYIGEGVDLTTLYNTGGMVVAEYDATPVTNFTQTAGTTILRRPGTGSAGTYYINGGHVETGLQTLSGTALTYPNVTWIIGNASVKLVCEGTIPKIILQHPNSKIDLSHVPEALTITALEGDPIALQRNGLYSGMTTITGAAITISAIDEYGKTLPPIFPQ